MSCYTSQKEDELWNLVIFLIDAVLSCCASITLHALLGKFGLQKFACVIFFFNCPCLHRGWHRLTIQSSTQLYFFHRLIENIPMSPHKLLQPSSNRQITRIPKLTTKWPALPVATCLTYSWDFPYATPLVKPIGLNTVCCFDLPRPEGQTSFSSSFIFCW